MRIQSQGFSVVELAVVVAVVGRVAALAVPRSTGLEKQVRASEVASLATSLRNAAAEAHIQYAAAGGHSTSATLNGRSVHLQNGYPDTGPNGIREVVGNVPDFVSTSTAETVVFSKSTAPKAVDCSVTYMASPDALVAAKVTDVRTSGC
jgi:Tfp pilus assembly protein FimT